jgi:hypothetical protein
MSWPYANLVFGAEKQFVEVERSRAQGAELGLEMRRPKGDLVVMLVAGTALTMRSLQLV